MAHKTEFKNSSLLTAEFPVWRLAKRIHTRFRDGQLQSIVSAAQVSPRKGIHESPTGVLVSASPFPFQLPAFGLRNLPHFNTNGINEELTFFCIRPVNILDIVDHMLSVIAT